jgi:DNA-binding cell septation regulator SpoVG
MATEIDVIIDDERVRRFKDADTSKLKAFCNVTIGPVTINNCRIVDGASGAFLGFPEGEVYVDRKGSEKRTRYIWIEDPAVKDACDSEAKRVLASLDSGSGASGGAESNDDVPF